MSEITKLYKNAGVKYLMYVVDSFPPVEYPQIDFNEKKQLELIKFILGKGVYYDTDKNCQEIWFHYTDDIENASYKPFDEAIAEFINILWQDLTEEEKQQVKGILE